jgi:hypothetical protein
MKEVKGKRDSVATYFFERNRMKYGARARHWLIWACIVLMPVGCRGPAVTDVNASKGRSANEWLQVLPKQTDWAVWQVPLDRSQWELVPATNELEAEALLRATATVALSEDKVARLVPGKHAKGLPFLVRAVGSTRNNSGFEVHASSLGELWVAGGALSHRTVPIERRAIVVWLERTPSRVYVTFSVAE